MNFKPYKLSHGEEYMSLPMRMHFIDILNKWKHDLIKEIEDINNLITQDTAENYPDPIDRANQEEAFSFQVRTKDRERKIIKEIESTIQLIKNNEYGWCATCGVEIGILRLEARPTATLCIDCKTVAEIREKQIAS